jgi:hypothetical protein
MTFAREGAAPARDHSTTPTVASFALTSFLLTVNSQGAARVSQPGDASNTNGARRSARTRADCAVYCSVGVVQSITPAGSSMNSLETGLIATFEVVDVPLR